MAEWRWHLGPVSGKCQQCQKVLIPGCVLVDWPLASPSTYHADCLYDVLTEIAAQKRAASIFPWGVPHP